MQGPSHGRRRRGYEALLPTGYRTFVLPASEQGSFHSAWKTVDIPGLPACGWFVFTDRERVPALVDVAVRRLADSNDAPYFASLCIEVPGFAVYPADPAGHRVRADQTTYPLPADCLGDPAALCVKQAFAMLF